MTELSKTFEQHHAIHQSITRLADNPNELMVRYLQGLIVQDPAATLSDAKQFILHGSNSFRDLLDGPAIAEGLVEVWFNEARRRQAWLNDLAG